MKNFALRQAKRAATLTVLLGAFAVAGTSAALAETAVSDPGATVTKPCTATVGTITDTKRVPPVSATATTSCTI